MTTNEREAFQKEWNRMMNSMFDYGPHEERYTDEDEELAWQAWLARSALDKRQEVTEKMVERACQEFFKQQELKWGIGLVDVHRAHWIRIMRATLNEALKSSEVWP